LWFGPIRESPSDWYLFEIDIDEEARCPGIGRAAREEVISDPAESPRSVPAALRPDAEVQTGRATHGSAADEASGTSIEHGRHRVRRRLGFVVERSCELCDEQRVLSSK